MADKLYCYAPDYSVLKNKANIKEQSVLENFERRMVAQRMQEPVPTGVFNLEHLQDIHHHLFQDVYDWAGEIRKVEINKGNEQFQFRQFITQGMDDVQQRLKDQNYLNGLDKQSFSKQAGIILGDINYVHPFREGNGRSQMLYLKQLGHQAGHSIDLSKFDQQQWLHASKQAHNADYTTMSQAIEGSISSRAKEKSQTYKRPKISRPSGKENTKDRSR